MNIENYDICIIGAGPSGCQCALKLAERKLKVLLVDRFSSFKINNFSSAGTPLETLKRFNLNKEVVGSYWNNIEIFSTHNHHIWKSNKVQGAVMDFAKLKEFISNKAVKKGCKLLLGWSFENLENDLIIIKNNEERKYIKAKVIVDATGPNRSVISKFAKKDRKYLIGIGIEYLIETKEKIIPKTLTFFLGYKWMPHGYGWIFPMNKNKYKIGVGYFKSDDKIINLTQYVEKIIHENLKLKKYKILDKHGGTLKYNLRQKDDYYHKNIIAIGDTISSVNPLGGEGIRHGMYSANVASKYIINYLKGNKISFDKYKYEMKKYFGMKYKLSELFAYLVYMKIKDESIDKGIKYISKLSTKEIIGILFNYKFKPLIKNFKLIPYFYLKKLIKHD